jgi:hypothetical protein
MAKTTPCAQCPWRLSNQGKPHEFKFYTKGNLRRLWNQIRRGGRAQSCHLTDPSHPDHVAVGAKPGATVQECPGSVILVLREVKKMANGNSVIEPEDLDRYRATRRTGLTNNGIAYWLVSRMHHAGMPFIGGAKLPDVDIDDPEIGLPASLEEG